MAKSAGASFENSRKNCAEIIHNAESGNYSQVYLLHGTEGYFIDKIEGYITENSLNETDKSFNLTVVYGKETTGKDVVALARRYPMMAERQVIVVREAQTMRGIEDIAHYLASPLQSTVLVIAHRDKAMDKRSSLYKKFSSCKGAVLFESVPPREWEVGKFITDVLAQWKLKAEPAAVAIISENIGCNLIRISQEIEKLHTRLGSDPNHIITTGDIEDNIGISKSFNNFELCKSLSYKKFDKALRIAEHLSANPKESPIVLTINALFTHYQRITTLGFIRYKASRLSTAMPSDMELAKRLKLPSPFFLDEYKSAINHYSLSSCVMILGLLRTWDGKTKGIDTGSAEDSELLRDLILRISVS